jgi:hypothetical protein
MIEWPEKGALYWISSLVSNQSPLKKVFASNMGYFWEKNLIS